MSGDGDELCEEPTVTRGPVGADPAGLDPRTAQELERARRKLLDLGTRNRLIHVNRASRSSNCLNIINERSDDIFRILRADSRSMRFKPMGEDETGTDEAVVFEADETELDESRYTDNYLETPLGPDALQKRLLRIARNARTAEEEQGINILYLALGFLSWYEKQNSNLLREAPLVLIPVELVRDQGRSSYRIRGRDEDVTANLPLQERLKQDFGITLPEIEEGDEAWSPSGYFDQIAQTTTHQARWRIDRDAMQLGFFSFAKLLMHHDLDPENWSDKVLGPGRLISRLLAGESNPEPLTTSTHRETLDLTLNTVDPADLVQVVDADASQTKVIETVRCGRDTVVQGPPGTGKSQTIVNIIAAAVHDGKTVLFLAEKMAALSVVHRRLVRAGLQDICIELHSHKASKKKVYEELGRTLDAGNRAPSDSPGSPRHRELRDRLNEIDSELHRRLSDLDYTPFEALAEVARHIGVETPPAQLSTIGLERLTNDDRDSMADDIAGYAKALEMTGPVAEHPFAGCQALELQPTDLERLKQELEEAASAFSALLDTVNKLHDFGLMYPSTLEDAATCQKALSLICDEPTPVGSLVGVLFDEEDHPRLHEALKAGEEWRIARSECESSFKDAAWKTPVHPIRTEIARGQASLFVRWFGAYRRASSELGGLLEVELPRSASERLGLADQLIDVQEKRELLAADEPWLRSRLGADWRGERTNFAAALRASRWSLAVRRAGIATRGEAVRLIERLPSLEDVAATLAKRRAGAAEAVARPFERLRYALPSNGLGDSSTAGLESIHNRLLRMRTSLERYDEWARLGKRRSELMRVPLLAEVEGWISIGEIGPGQAENALRYAIAEARWAHACEQRSSLTRLRDEDRHALVRFFVQHEKDQFGRTGEAVRRKHGRQMPLGAAGQMGIIRGEIGKKRRHRPIRRLMEHAGTMVQRIKPVCLMSPISVAQFLHPGAVEFDLLVIDEASQVRPEDALGAIARSRQVVVVGDQKQLPPTSFFDRLTNMDDGEDDQEMEPRMAGAADMESILTLCEARGFPSQMLEWHYRSRDPSLMCVSNTEFYADRLVLPPSPLRQDPNYGMALRRVDGVYASRGSGSGRANTNLIEAQAIVDAVADHARECPTLSLGVVALSKAQSDIIAEVLEKKRREDPEVDVLLGPGQVEDVFVKNLENVQGDERDVMFVSVGYGPDAPGGRLRNMRFGPVNADGGERRLNVLFTRSRVRCQVFASFDPEEIDLRRATGEGPRILKRFLHFAKSGTMEQQSPTGGDPESPLEEDVARAIREFEYEADPQVGSSGFRIDIGVRHRDRPGQYILAVECDGATYHSAVWARERDRQRQEILENHGWRFHRIWSTDWFYRRPQEKVRLRYALEDARRKAHCGIRVPGANAPRDMVDHGSGETPATLAVEDAHAGSPEVPLLEAPDYRYARLEVTSGTALLDYPAERLSLLAAKVVQQEGPVHRDEVARRLGAAFGHRRAGRRILEAVEDALDALRYPGWQSAVMRQGAFWFTKDQQEQPPVRNRSGAAVRATLKAEILPPMEIRAAASWLDRENGRMEPDERIREVARIFGFQRCGENVRAAIRAALREDGHPPA